MADNSKEIKSLVKLRQQRPSFSRMISWEIGRCHNDQQTKKTKGKKKQDTAVLQNEGVEDDNNDDETAATDSADSSDYETATEDADADGNLNSLTSTDRFNFEELCAISGDEIDDDDDDDDELMMSCKSSVPDTTSITVHQEQHRRPSKKQKRKRKRYCKVTYIGELYNLANVFDPVENIDNVFNDVSEAGIEVAVQFRVPTLVELCLVASRTRKSRSTSNKQKTSQSQPCTSSDKPDEQVQVYPISRPTEQNWTLPIGLKKMLSDSNSGKDSVQNQLSFFLNKVLPVAENHVKQLKADIATNKFVPVRSVWNNVPCNPTPLDRGASYGSYRSSAFLFEGSMLYNRDADDYGFNFFNHTYATYPVLTSAMCALATTIDFMLPRQVNTTAITRVKHALELRYKLLVETYFDKVYPYVLWSRGLVSIATDCFKSLIDNSKDYLVKTMYLSEIAKMHAMFGDTKTGAQFYRLASETACEMIKCEHDTDRERQVNEIIEQEHILLASLYDTGLLDKDKSYQSSSYWGYVLSRSGSKDNSVFAAVDALLCYHLYHMNESQQYDECIEKLEKIVKTHDYFNYYLSMLYALQGRADVSTRLYRQCRFGVTGAPADMVLSYMGTKARNPWQPVLDCVIKQRSPIPPLKVIWRSNLQFPRLIKQRGQEGQISSVDLDLRFNELGQLTGNLQMLLPPIRNVALDPTSGSVIVNRFSNTRTWTRAYFDDKTDCHTDKLLVPTPTLIYTGADGTTVELVAPTVVMANKLLYRFENPTPCPIILYWKNSDGLTAKLNLLTEIKNEAIKKMKAHVEKIKDKHLAEDDYQLLLKIVDKAGRMNLPLQNSCIDVVHSRLKREKKESEKIKKKGVYELRKQERKEKKWSIMRHYEIYNGSYPSIKLNNEPFVFGSTIVLNIGTSFMDTTQYLMFINTQDRSSFLHYEKVECGDFYMVSTVTGKCLLYDSFRNSSDEEYVMLLDPGKRFINIYNGAGCHVSSIDIAKTLGHQVDRYNRYDIHIIDQDLYGVAPDRTRIWKLPIDYCEDTFNVDDYVCWSMESIPELWQELVQNSNSPPKLQSMEYIGHNYGGGVGKLLMLNLNAGLAFVDPQTMEFVSIQVPDIYSQHYEFTSGGQIMKGKFETCRLLAEKCDVNAGVYKTRTVVRVQHKLFVLETRHKSGDNTVTLSMVFSVILPGVAKDVSFIGTQAGLLVSLSQQTDNDLNYREHVLQYDFNSKLCGILPCVDGGPRSFLVKYFNNNPDNGTDTALEGWHAYMKDGRDGILCVKLNQ